MLIDMNSCQISNEFLINFMNLNRWAKSRMNGQDFNVLHLADFCQFCPFFHFVRIFIFGKVGTLLVKDIEIDGWLGES
jgi:hypothetical protein